MPLKSLVPALSLLLSLTAPGLVAAEESAPAWIVESQALDGVMLEVFAALRPGESGRYELIAEKSGASGSSVSRQGGVIPESGGAQVGPLTRSRLSLRQGEILDAELRVTTSAGRTHSETVRFFGR